MQDAQLLRGDCLRGLHLRNVTCQRFDPARRVEAEPGHPECSLSPTCRGLIGADRAHDVDGGRFGHTRAFDGEVGSIEAVREDQSVHRDRDLRGGQVGQRAGGGGHQGESRDRGECEEELP